MPTTVQCPQCGKPVAWTADSKHRPFCSNRCRLIDLGAWAAEEHKIASIDPSEELIPEDLRDSSHSS